MLLTLILLMMVGIVCLAGVSCSHDTSAHPGAQTTVTRQNIRSLSKEQIQEKLRTLEVRQAPMPKMGAMCYEMAASPSRAEYMCNKCGEKTLYSNKNARFVSSDLEACRREFRLLQSETELALILDESSYCAHCSPKAEKHQLMLIVNYTDGSKHSSAPISLEDLRILRCFLKGQLSYETFNEGSSPLKKMLPRLRELLGIDAGKEIGRK